MRDLILEQKTGFTTSLPFKIFEPNGQLFYSSDFTDHIEKGERLDFNLPAGIYKYDGNFIKLPLPVPVKMITLPPKERHYNSKRYEIIFGSNPNKCTIFYKDGVILFDNSLKDKPLYIKYGIYYHELGHHFYRTESKADLYSAKKMLEKGFNPSQIGMVELETLSSSTKGEKRKENIVNHLTSNKG
jgi:hypothetical protein